MTTMTRWLDVEVGNDDIELNTLPSNLALVDLQNDNEYKLLVGDLGKGEEGPKLKIFRGAMQVLDMPLPDLPLGVVGFYTNESVPKPPPVIAVAFTSAIYMYRNMKLFYKYYLPSIDLSTSESEIWKQIIDPQNHNVEVLPILTENLKALPQKVLSLESQNFVRLSLDQQLEYVEHLTELPSRKVPEIACITTLKMHSVERNSVSCLVVGTEEGEVIVLDPQTFTQLSIAKLCAIKRTPFQMATTGLYNVDYRITVATREKCVCVLKRDWPEGRMLFATDEHIIAMEVMPTDHSVLVICCDNTLACFSKKGKKQWCLPLEHRAVALTLVPVVALGVTLAAVALASGHVHLYHAKAKRDSMFVRDVASVMKFGQLGQEEHVFITITNTGNLMLKILKRTADFNTHAAGVESLPAAGQRPWHIPKKSKLFLEQSVRERENPVAMHRNFQEELNRMRLFAARSLLAAHARADNSVAAGAMAAVRLAAEVEGLGPVFRVTIIVENTSPDKAAIGLAILFHVPPANYKVSNPYIKVEGLGPVFRVTIIVENTSPDKAAIGLAILFHVPPANYKVSNPYIKVPLLPPNGKLQFPTKVEEVFEELGPDVLFRAVTGDGGERAQLKVLLVKDGRPSPALAATLRMPPTDPMMLPLDKLNQEGFEEMRESMG